MKKISVCILGCASLLIVSCSKEKSLENHLDGETWKYTKMTSVVSGKTTEKTDLTGTVTFKKDGTGSSKESETAQEKAFNWKVIANGDSLQFTQGTSKLTYKVITNKKNNQVWSLGSETGSMYLKVELERK